MFYLHEANVNVMGHWKTLVHISDPGIFTQNEDECYIGKDIAFVLDGATGLGPSLLNNPVSDARWFVENVSKCLALSWHRNNLIKDALDEALAQVASRWCAMNIGQAPVERLPSAAMALVAHEGSSLVVMRLGDCEAYMLGEQGVERVFTDSLLHKLDHQALAKLAELLAGGDSFDEAMQLIRPTLLRNRSLVNAPDGYPVLSLVRRECVEPEVTRVPSTYAKRILLASDGFSAAWQDYGLTSPEDLLRSSNPEDIFGELLIKMRNLEKEDSEARRFPRFKCHDDASVILLELST